MGTESVFLFPGALRKASGDDGPTLHEVAPSPTPPQPTLADRPASVDSDAQLDVPDRLFQAADLGTSADRSG